MPKGWQKDPYNKDVLLLRTPLKLIGAKTDIRSFLYQLFPEYIGYVEPFIGSGAVFMGIVDNEERVDWLTDINPYVINFFEVLQGEPETFWDHYKTCLNFFLEAEKKSLADAYAAFYWFRDQITEVSSPILQAVYFYIITKSCVNGIFRTAKKTGKCNSSFCKEVRTRGWMTEEWFKAVLERIQYCCFINCDYKKSLQDVKWDTTFIFLDPPYEHKSKREPKGTVTTYNGIKFLEKDFLEMEELLRVTPAKWLMTVSDTALMREVFKEYEIVPWTVYYRASSKSESRGKKPELLIANYPIKDKCKILLDGNPPGKTINEDLLQLPNRGSILG